MTRLAIVLALAVGLSACATIGSGLEKRSSPGSTTANSGSKSTSSGSTNSASGSGSTAPKPPATTPALKK